LTVVRGGGSREELGGDAGGEAPHAADGEQPHGEHAEGVAGAQGDEAEGQQVGGAHPQVAEHRVAVAEGVAVAETVAPAAEVAGGQQVVDEELDLEVVDRVVARGGRAAEQELAEQDEHEDPQREVRDGEMQARRDAGPRAQLEEGHEQRGGGEPAHEGTCPEGQVGRGAEEGGEREAEAEARHGGQLNRGRDAAGRESGSR
jgi:hypothetical protein